MGRPQIQFHLQTHAQENGENTNHAHDHQTNHILPHIRSQEATKYTNQMIKNTYPIVYSQFRYQDGNGYDERSQIHVTSSKSINILYI
mmetsp:Transcript_15901/g.32775  ORF Transcript_15901/g.32775 Transcript_15901/m.32775 type:complete len:88 (-) Transcript_15901:9-272(-)